MSARKHDLRPLHREEQRALKHRKLVAWDIETKGTHIGEALFGSICPNGICVLESLGDAGTFFSDLDVMLAYLVERYPGYYIAAHNARGYEFNYMKDTLVRWLNDHPSFRAETLHQGETIIGFELIECVKHTITRGKNKGAERVKERRWHFIDTYPLFNDTLANVAKAYCPELPKGEVKWKQEDWNYDNLAHRSYLVRDCEILLAAYPIVETLLFRLFHARVGLTAGSTAIHAWTASIPVGHVYYRMSRHVEAFARRAYRGGLVLPGTTTRPQHDISMVDVKGAYGYQMLTHEYPVGAPIHCFSYQEGYVGVYHVHVNTPASMPFGIVPLADTSTYPLGKFSTIITSVEMDYALALGYQFEVYEGWFWTKTEPIFREFMTQCQELETTEVEGGFPYKPLAKLMRNSLYGKFCTKETGMRYQLCAFDTVEPLDAGIVIDPDTGDQIPGLYTMEERIDENYIMPIWGALITAYERVYLAQRAYALYEFGASSVYGDTDSLAANIASVKQCRALGLLDNTGKYGGWEDEGTAADMIVAAPKVYIMARADGSIMKARAKGLPMAQMDERYPLLKTLLTFIGASQEMPDEERTQYQFVTSHSLRSRLKNPQLPIKLERKRRLSLVSRSPNWDYDAKTGRISPKHVYNPPLDGVERTPVTCLSHELLSPLDASMVP